MRRRAAALLLVLSSGCADGTAGALEQAEADVECSGADTACADRGLDRPVAVGASVTLDVAMSSPGSSALPMALLSADPTVLAVEGRTATAAGEGFAALLFVADGSGEVVDFVHVHTRAPDALRIASPAEDGGIPRDVTGRTQLLAGDELTLLAQPQRGDVALGGAFEAVWTVVETPEDGSDPVVSLLETGFGGERRVVARSLGQAEVVVQGLGLEARIAIEVLP